MNEEKYSIDLYSGINQKSADSFVRELKSLELVADEITIRINSEGGSMLYGWNIVSAILNCKVKVRGVVVGVAASMATAVLASCHVAEMMDYSSLMFHNPFNPDDPELKDHPQLTTFRSQLIDLYHTRWGIEKDVLENMIDGRNGYDETWVQPLEAKERGIVSSVRTSGKQLMAMMIEVENSSPLAKNKCEAISEILKKVDNNLKLKKIMLEKIKAKLKLQVDASEDTVVAKIGDLDNKIGELHAANGILEVEKAGLEAEKTGLTQEVENGVAEIALKNDEIVDLKAQVEAFKTEKYEAEKASRVAFIENAITAGKISEDSKETWLGLIEANEASTRQVIDGMKEIVSPKLSGKTKSTLSEKVEDLGKDTKSKSDSKKSFILPTMSAIMKEVASKTK